MKKLLSILLALMMVFALVGCSSDSSDTATTTTDNGSEDVAVLWYTNADAYLSTVRAALDAKFEADGINYKDYDANGVSGDQMNQVDTCIAAGVKVLVVNQVDSGSSDVAKNILEKAEAAGVKVVFFNRSVAATDEEAESLLNKYGSAFVGTDFTEAGHMEGKMVGDYLLANYDKVDLNSDGVISYLVLKGDEGNAEAIARTQYGVEDANAVLTAAGKPEMEYYDATATTKYLLDANGTWSEAAGNDHMANVLGQYNLDNGNMVEVVIANNDSMAIGAINALQDKGMNKTDSDVIIPVFGVDALDQAKILIDDGIMAGTVKQDGEGMATVTAIIAENLLNGEAAVSNIPDAYNAVGTWRVNIPYSLYQK